MTKEIITTVGELITLCVFIMAVISGAAFVVSAVRDAIRRVKR